MVEIICVCPKLAYALGKSIPWQRLVQYLDRQGISASIWVEGKDTPAFVQVPGFTKSWQPAVNSPAVDSAAFSALSEVTYPADKVAKTLGESTRWQLLVRYLQAHQIPARIWVAGEDILSFNQLQVASSRAISAPAKAAAASQAAAREPISVGVASARAA